MYHQPFIHVAKLKEVVYHIFSQLPSEYVCKSEAISPYIGLDLLLVLVYCNCKRKMDDSCMCVKVL